MVLASLDGFEAQTLDLSIAGTDHVYDTITRTEITENLKQIELQAGEGRVVICGTAEDFDRDCRLIDEELKKWQ